MRCKLPISALTVLLAAFPLAAQQQQQDSPPPKQQEQKKPSTADENPFPEDVSKKAAQPEKQPEKNEDAPKTAPPRSDADANSSSSKDNLQGIDLLGDKDSRISDGAGKVIFNPKLAEEDVRVGGFYLKNGDYKGAYTRYKEATLVNPGNADAVFGLAESARGLKKNDEALENYQLYLDAIPNGKKSKEALKALKSLSAAPKS